jgi:hypothetical protein
MVVCRTVIDVRDRGSPLSFLRVLMMDFSYSVLLTECERARVEPPTALSVIVFAGARAK